MDYNVNLIESRISKVNIVSDSVETLNSLQITCKTNIRQPLAKDDNTVLLVTVVEKSSDDENPMELYFELETVFSFDTIPEDWNKAAIDFCLPRLKKLVEEKFAQLGFFLGINESK